MAADPKITGLPAAAPASIFRVVDRQLRADGALGRVVKTFRSWEGHPSDKNEPGRSDLPYIRLTPRVGPEPERWYAASTQTGILYIEAELVVAGTCYDDIITLWWAVQRACYPVDAAARRAFQKRLADANGGGAFPALLNFSMPVVVNDPAGDGRIEGRAWIAVQYKFDINPTSPGL